MSVDGETSRVMKGVQNGACDYLVKPIRMEELQNIWQHVYRKRIHGVRNIAGQAERLDELRNGSFSNGDMISGKKRKDVDNKNHDNECSDPSSVKKARVVWTVDLHHKFLKAVNQIGLDNVGPKKILDLMGVPWLTRANVASHLQKYRLHLSRLQKENEVKAVSEWIKLSDNISSTNPAGNVCFQNAIRQTSVTVRQNIVINGNYDQVPSIHSKQQLKPHFQSDHRFDQLRLPMPQLQLNPVSYNPIPSSREANIYGIGKVTKVENTGMANNLCHNFQFPLKNLIVGNGSSALRFWDEEFSGYCSQGDFHPPNTDLVSVDSFGYGNQELTADVPRQMYDSVNFDCEHPSDPIIDQRLYIE
ncbi:hypothetical protein DH2020_003705 [Rehmannia glutinosa]|uniref:Response regulatory domain-containing protein n=1 Tax=Rehmannia glutinosa TaxID=99300 RepID=A0ABR0XME8_REHGL